MPAFHKFGLMNRPRAGCVKDHLVTIPWRKVCPGPPGKSSPSCILPTIYFRKPSGKPTCDADDTPTVSTGSLLAQPVMLRQRTAARPVSNWFSAAKKAATVAARIKRLRPANPPPAAIALARWITPGSGTYQRCLPRRLRAASAPRNSTGFCQRPSPNLIAPSPVIPSKFQEMSMQLLEDLFTC